MFTLDVNNPLLAKIKPHKTSKSLGNEPISSLKNKRQTNHRCKLLTEFGVGGRPNFYLVAKVEIVVFRHRRLHVVRLIWWASWAVVAVERVERWWGVEVAGEGPERRGGRWLAAAAQLKLAAVTFYHRRHRVLWCHKRLERWIKNIS